MSSYSFLPRPAVPTPSRRPDSESPIEPKTPTYDLLGRPIDPRYLPYAITKHANFIPAFMKNLRDYFMAALSHDLEDHPVLLAHLTFQRERIAHVKIQDKAPSTLSYFSAFLAHPVRMTMDALGYHLSREEIEIPTPVVGALSGHVWRAKSSDSAILVVETIGPSDGNVYFPLMDRKANQHYVFNEKSNFLEGEDSVVIKVGIRGLRWRYVQN
jgi:hypothetical protein